MASSSNSAPSPFDNPHRHPPRPPVQHHAAPPPPPTVGNVSNMSGVVGLGLDTSPRSDSVRSVAGGTPGGGTAQTLNNGLHQSSATPPPPPTASAPRPIRRRMRMITSCLECRRRKLKCNKSQPCTNCMKFSRECHYLGAKLDEASQLKLTEIKEKVGSLERQLERDVAQSTSRAAYQQRIIADDVEGDFDEERDLEITPMVALDLTYDTYGDELDGADDIIDLGIQVGKMRITERIGGLNRPRISEEIQAGLSGKAPSPGYRGPDETMSEGAGSEVSVPDFLKPTDSYIPPTSGFFFGQIIQSPSILTFLPNEDAGNHLLQHYFAAVHPIARCVHRPSFEGQYAQFWDDVKQGIEPRPSTQAVVFAAWFSAVVSMDEARITRDFGYSKVNMIGNMKIGTEAALSKANFLRTTNVETMQAFIMYMIPLCRAEVSRAHSVLVGAAVRMAECMGLHRDGEAYGLTPLETLVRRLLWHQLCFLDIRTCEAQGPRPAIRREDYDTKLPINCEEDDLTPYTSIPPEPAEQWTSTLLPLMRFEINEMMRIIWTDRRKLETRKTTLTAVLTKIENFRTRMFDKYDRFLNDHVPIQRYAKRVMHLLIYRLRAMVLHPYHSNTTNPMPPRLISILVMSGIAIIDIAMQLETDPLFQDWAWYIGAYQQFQIALLLATEIYYRPNNKEADRIWRCLDYVFNLDPNMPREQKGPAILAEVMGKTGVYQGMRKMRAPTTIARAVPDKNAIKSDGVPHPPMQPPHPPQMNPQHQQQQQQQHMAIPPGVKTEPGMPPMPSTMGMMGHQQGGPHMQQQQQQRMSPPGPPPNIVFAGVSNGEALWGLPPRNLDGSEASSDGGSVAGHAQQHGNMGMQASGNVMENIDWDTINTLFPPDPQTGEINFNTFADPSIGMKWQG